MQKMDKRDRERRDAAIMALNTKHDEMKEAWKVVEDAVAAYNSKIDEYNEALDESKSWVEYCVNAIDGYIDERSEKWREGDRAQEFEAWKSEFENADLDEIEHLNISEFEPTDETSEHAETLENIPEQP